MYLNCLAPTYVVASKPGLQSFSKESNKVRLFAKEQSYKRGAVGAKDPNSINITFALLESLLGDLQVWNDRLLPRRINL